MKIPAFIVMLALIVQMMPTYVFAETTSEKIKKAEQQKKETEAQKEAVADKKEALEGEREERKSYLDQLNADLTEISENLEDIERRIDDKLAEIEVTQNQINEAVENENYQYDLMKKRIKHVYESGDPSFLTSLLTAKSYAEFLNKTEYVSRI